MSLDLNIDVGIIDESKLDEYIRLFIKEKRSDQLLLCSRSYNMSLYLDLLDVSNLDEVKCIANTLKLFGSKSYYDLKIDFKIVSLLEKEQHLFVVFRILFLATVEYNPSILSYGFTVISKILQVLNYDDCDADEEALKCLYNLLNYFSLVESDIKHSNKLLSKNFPIEELFSVVRRLVLNPSVTSSALNCLLQFKEYIASQVSTSKILVEPVELIHGITVEFKDKELVDYLIQYLDVKFTHENEETGTVFGIIAYLFSWMSKLSFPISERDSVKPWQFYLKSVLLPDDISRSLVLGADTSLPHRIISSFSAQATLGITKEEVVEISSGQVRPPPMSAFTSERLQELVFCLFDNNVDEMIKYTGLGIVMGFLVNRGLFTPSVQEQCSSTPKSADWNAVTGQKDNDLYKDLQEMTEEEKEAEAEKLFVLFERLNKSGINVQLKKD